MESTFFIKMQAQLANLILVLFPRPVWTELKLSYFLELITSVMRISQRTLSLFTWEPLEMKEYTMLILSFPRPVISRETELMSILMEEFSKHALQLPLQVLLVMIGWSSAHCLRNWERHCHMIL